MITANFLGVQIFRNFTVLCILTPVLQDNSLQEITVEILTWYELSYSSTGDLHLTSWSKWGHTYIKVIPANDINEVCSDNCFPCPSWGLNLGPLAPVANVLTTELPHYFKPMNELYPVKGTMYLKHLGPVVQSIVSLTKSLVNDLLSLLVRLKSSVLIFFAEKMRGAFALQKLLSFFRQKMALFFMYNMFEILTSR